MALLVLPSISPSPIYQGDTVVIQITAANNASGKTLAINGQAVTATAQDINSISFLAVDVKAFGDKTLNYSTNIPVTVTDGPDSGVINYQLTPAIGADFAQITAVEGIFLDDVTVVIGDYGYGDFLTGSGTMDIASGNFTRNGLSTYQYWVKDGTDGVWSDPVTETFNALDVVEAPLLIVSIGKLDFGQPFTIITAGNYDLTQAATISATMAGIVLTGKSNVTSKAVTFTCPVTGVSLIDNSGIVLTINI